MSDRGLHQIVEESAECSTCGACPGEPCEDSKGDSCSPHMARMRAAGFDVEHAQDVADLMGALRSGLKKRMKGKR